MIVQAAKIIGSGLATIGLTDILLPVTRNENILISKIIKIELIKKGIATVGSMIKSIPKNRIFYVYNFEFSLVGTYKSIVEAARSLNPNSNIELGTNLRGREMAIARAKNKSKLVDNEKGSFYFAENPIPLLIGGLFIKKVNILWN